MIEPKNGEWWLCERGGVKTVFLRKDDEWRSDERDTYSYCDVVPLFKMIEDKPSDCAAGVPKRTRTEYEKVIESIFDLRDEFERGELSFQDSEGGWVSVVNESELVYFFDKDEIYRKVEKEIDWTSDVMGFLRRELRDGGCVRNASIESLGDNFGCVNIDISFRHERFLELCRVALRANGEIE